MAAVRCSSGCVDIVEVGFWMSWRRREKGERDGNGEESTTDGPTETRRRRCEEGTREGRPKAEGSRTNVRGLGAQLC